MKRPLQIAAIVAVAAACLAGCAGPGGGAGAVSSGLSVTGNEKGGKIPGGVGGGNTTAAMSLVTAHCAQYGKKAFITRMELPTDGGLMAFECHEQKK